MLRHLLISIVIMSYAAAVVAQTPAAAPAAAQAGAAQPKPEVIEIQPPEFTPPSPEKKAAEPAAGDTIPPAEVFAPLPDSTAGDVPPPDVASEGNDSDVMDNWKTSLMYNTGSIRSLTDAIAAARERKLRGDSGIAVPDGSGGAAPPPRKPAEAPAFFLNTILYRSASEWVLWINGKKVTPKEPMDGLVVDAVSKVSVNFSWKTDDLSYISPNWQELIKKNKGISVEQDGKLVKFRLYPNQTFVSRAMEIIEGKGTSSSLTTEGEAGKPAPADAPAANTNMPPAAAGAVGGKPSLPSAAAMPPMP